MADAQDTQFSADPEGSAKRWQQEFAAARDALRDWHNAAEKCDKEYRDEADRDDGQQSLNLYASGTDLKEATLYGNTPAVDVERRDGDQDDDDARVAANLLKRVLNGMRERDDDNFDQAIGLALKDWLIPGLGTVWTRLDRKTQAVEGKPPMTQPQVDASGQPVLGEDGQPAQQEVAPAVPPTTQVVSEDAPTDYVFWKDLLWSPARVWSDLRWVARRALLSKKSFTAKFGDEQVPISIGADPKDVTVPKTPWARIEVWETWDKENQSLWYYVEGHSRVVVPVGAQANPDGSIPDQLALPGFWPCPEFLIEGNSTSKLVPRPSYTRAQHLYESVNDATTRIADLREAIKACGVYDKTVGELADLLRSGSVNKLVPAANYKALAEKGGIAACIAWLPLEMFVAALDKLRELRREDIDLLFQVDGTSDIMRGQATESGATATEQAIKAKYGSIRGDKAQKRFARFCSDAQRIRAAIVCKHFSPQTIVELANARGLPQQDQQRVPNALAILKSDFGRFRITVKAESVSLTDYAANRQEAMDVIGMVGQYFAAIQPLAMAAPQLAPQLLELLTVFVSRVKGGDAAEAVLDEIVKQATGMAQQAAMTPPQPDPKVQVAQANVQTAQTRAGAEQFKARAGMAQTAMEMQQAAAEHEQGMQKLEAEVRANALKTALGKSEPQEAVR